MLRLFIVSAVLIFSTTVLAVDDPTRQPSQTFHISGTVVNAVSGQVVSRIQVSIGPAVKASASQVITTADDGRFEFDNLVPGKYWLQAEGRGFSPQRLDQHEEFSTAIAVGPGLSSDGLSFRLAPDASIIGTITDEQNEAVADARVMLFRTGVQGGAAFTRIRAQAQTDDQGHYHLSHVPSGKYFIAVSGSPWYAENRPRSGGRAFVSGDAAGTDSDEEASSQLDVTYPLTFYSGVTDPAAATALTVNHGDRLVVDLTLAAVQCVHLRLTDSAVQPGQSLNATLRENIFGTSLPIPATLNAAGPGDLEISGLAPGQYSLQLQTFGNNVVSREQQIDVSDNSEIMFANNAMSPSIKGMVQSEDGRPLPGNLNVMLLSRAEQSLSAQTTAKGEFEMTPQTTRPGKYQVTIFGIPDTFIKSVSATGASLIGRECNVAGNSSVYLKIIVGQGAGRIDGTVLRDGKPFAGAMIVLVPQDIQHNSILVRRDQSDSDGTFSLYSVLPGSYAVVAIQNGWDLQWLNPDVLSPYVKAGTAVNVASRGRYDIKVNVQ